MIHARTLSIFGGLLALGLVQCSADRQRESRSTSTTRMWREDTAQMTPASRLTSTAAPEPSAQSTTPSGSAQTGTMPMRMPIETLSDAQIAGVLNVANETEIQQARVAIGKSKNARVLAFARMMVADHGAANKKQGQLMRDNAMTTSGSNLSSQLNTNAQAAAQVLQTSAGADFDRAYIDAQVSAHEQVLNAIDKELLPAAQNSELRALLEEIRPKIEQHLDQARQIQQSMMK